MDRFDARRGQDRRKLLARALAAGLGRATLFTVASVGAGAGTAQADSRGGIVGQTAPEPRAEFWIDADGRPTRFSLAAQRGKWVHLKFWQSWCPGCHAHGFTALVKLAAAFAGEPRVVNVALQTVFEGFGSNGADKVRHTQQRYRLPILFGHDPGNGPRAPAGGTMARFRSGGTPWHVVVDPKGVVVFDGFSIDADRAIATIRAQLRNG
jgi:thiol-disulfide isomerase/thioredoxin